jgi:hypothetical protein
LLIGSPKFSVILTDSQSYGIVATWDSPADMLKPSPAVQDFCGDEISMADNSLQKTAITASRAMWLPDPPAGLMHR